MSRLRKFLLVFLALMVMAGCERGGGDEKAQFGATDRVLKFIGDPGAKAHELTAQLAEEFREKTGVRIEIIRGPSDATERLAQYLQYLGAKSEDIDVYQVDVIWPGILADHMVDLKAPFGDELDQFFPRIVENNTVDGKLVCIPWFGDAGMLYYRKDLLEKYQIASPPKTWDELESTAEKIQAGERGAGNQNLWGFVWQGKAYEGLTCDALEWQVSHGGGTIVERDGTISINNPKASAALARAAKWVKAISPEGVITYQEEEARHLFQQGNAAFMRNWPYAYALCNADDSPIRGKFDVTVLPAADASSPVHAATLGGWQLAVSKYSRNQKDAIEWVKFLASAEVQKRRAIELSLLPTRATLYGDDDITSAIPFMPAMKDIFMGAVARPSTVTGDAYNEVSTTYFRNVHRVLSGEQTPDAAVTEIERTLKQILGK